MDGAPREILEQLIATGRLFKQDGLGGDKASPLRGHKLPLLEVEPPSSFSILVWVILVHTPVVALEKPEMLDWSVHCHTQAGKL